MNPGIVASPCPSTICIAGKGGRGLGLCCRCCPCVKTRQRIQGHEQHMCLVSSLPWSHFVKQMLGVLHVVAAAPRSSVRWPTCSRRVSRCAITISAGPIQRRGSQLLPHSRLCRFKERQQVQSWFRTAKWQGRIHPW